MADPYGKVRSGGLKLKGEKKHKKKKKKRKADADETSVELRHGVFWPTTRSEDLTGTCLIESDHGCYLSAVDDGTLTITPPWKSIEGNPGPTEMFTLVRVNDSRIAVKTAFNRYVSCELDSGAVSCRSEAMGTCELWQPVIQQDGEVLLRGANKKFFACPKEAGDLAHATAPDMQTPGTWFRVLSSAERAKKKKKRGHYDDLEGGLDDVETSFSKKYQSYQTRDTEEDRRALAAAKKTGKLREAMLDRREQMKADRYCK